MQKRRCNIAPDRGKFGRVADEIVPAIAEFVQVVLLIEGPDARRCIAGWIDAHCQVDHIGGVSRRLISMSQELSRQRAIVGAMRVEKRQHHHFAVKLVQRVPLAAAVPQMEIGSHSLPRDVPVRRTAELQAVNTLMLSTMPIPSPQALVTIFTATEYQGVSRYRARTTPRPAMRVLECPAS